MEFLVISKLAGFCLSSNTNESRLCWQDPIPPELVNVLQNSKDPLLQKLFPVAEGNQNNIKTQNRAAVVTVVSKFKVHPIQVLFSTAVFITRQENSRVGPRSLNVIKIKQL